MYTPIHCTRRSKVEPFGSGSQTAVRGRWSLNDSSFLCRRFCTPTREVVVGSKVVFRRCCRQSPRPCAVVKRKLYPLLDSLGVEHGGLHAFRHTNSTLMDRLGVPLKVRQERLGHSDASLTLGVYTHVVSEDDVRFAEQFDGILRPNAPKKENGSGVEPPKPSFLN